ncbi:beta-lactamase domain protein [Mycobacterium ulcerans str. Harvey]|uniref:Beta-lactamase domain protein n=1 Tax=Mycobacterium ulcerans str. Harvey TaxID=1299332 RepID=A0ABN0R9Z6_MYCUL|nr:beta-lactamase domain protein [Mycobacterium ulcerans str. Harvey]
MTPPGLRAQQTMDMLNSDWPIGPAGVATLAAPSKVDSVEAPWRDSGGTGRRPRQCGHQRSVATLHLTSSYGARQDIRLHTDDGGWVDPVRTRRLPPRQSPPGATSMPY